MASDTRCLRGRDGRLVDSGRRTGRACRLPGRDRIDPVAPSLERTGRQRHALARRARPHRDAGLPQSGGGLEQRGALGGGGGGVAGADDRSRAGRGAHGTAQGLARTHLQPQRVAMVARESLEGGTEAHRGQQLPGPVRRRGRLRIGETGAGHGRDQRHRRGTQGLTRQRREQQVARGCHRPGVKGVAGVEQPGADPGRLERAGKLLERGALAADHALERPVDRRHLDAVGQARHQRLLRGAHRQHHAPLTGLHGAGARGDQAQAALQREHLGHACSHPLAEAVADKGRRLDAPGRPLAGQRDLHGEERRLGQPGLAQLGTPARPQRRAHVEAQLRVEHLGAAVDHVAEHLLGVVELAAHADELAALPGKHPQERGGGLGRVADRLPALLPQGLGCSPRASLHQHGAPAAEGPPLLQRERDLARIELGAGTVERVGKRVGGDVDRGLGARRHQEELAPAGGHGPVPTRRLLEHHVGVGAAHAERADSGPPHGAGRPGLALGVHVERTATELDARVEALEVEAGHQLSVRQHQHRLDEAGDAAGRVEVADVALDRSDRAGPGLAGPERPGERRHLDRIAQRGAGAVGLDVADGLRVDARHRECLGDHLGLPGQTGRRVADLVGAVVVDGRALDDRVDDIAVAQGVLEAAQHHHADAAAEHGPGRLRVERTAAPVRRKHAAILVHVPGLVGQADGHAPGQRHVALAGEQRLAGMMDRHQRRRAGRLHRDAGSAQVQLVRHPHRQVVLVVAQDGVEHLEARHPPHEPGRAVDVPQEVAARAGPGVHADPPGESLRRPAGVLERLPRALEEQPLLRVQHLRLTGRDAEEAGVELLHIVEPGERGDEARVAQRRGVDERIDLVRLQQPDAAAPVAEQRPELVQVSRAREAAAQANDGDLGAHRAPPRRPWRAAMA